MVFRETEKGQKNKKSISHRRRDASGALSLSSNCGLQGTSSWFIGRVSRIGSTPSRSAAVMRSYLFRRSQLSPRKSIWSSSCVDICLLMRLSCGVIEYDVRKETTLPLKELSYSAMKSVTARVSKFQARSTKGIIRTIITEKIGFTIYCSHIAYLRRWNAWSSWHPPHDGASSKAPTAGLCPLLPRSLHETWFRKLISWHQHVFSKRLSSLFRPACKQRPVYRFSMDLLFFSHTSSSPSRETTPSSSSSLCPFTIGQHAY